MTRREEATFEIELTDFITGYADTSDKEFFERIICANTVIARCLSKFKDDYDELDTKPTPTVKEDTPVPSYFVVNAGAEKEYVNLGLYSTLEKARARIIEYENILNSLKAYGDWDEFIDDYDNGLTEITDYNISYERLDS